MPDQELPGYPSRPAHEDITNPDNNTQRVSTGPDELGPNGRNNSTEQRAEDVPAPNTGNSDEGDVTAEDRKILSAAYQNRDLDDADNEESMLDETDDDGDPLNEPTGTYGNAGAGLDVPGSEDDDLNENIGEEDEENNYYSLGGDNHEAQEEDIS